MLEKVCARCRVSQPRDAFYANRSRPDGLQRHCRACDRQRLDQADAARRAQRQQPAPLLADGDSLDVVLETHAEEVVDALWDAAWAGTPLVLAYLAERLCSPCPGPATDDEMPTCQLHLLAYIHTEELRGRLPATRPIIAAFRADPVAATATIAAAARGSA